jgi:adenylate cyclase
VAKLRLSYRISLVVAIPLLVLATGGLIAVRAYLGARSTVTALADELFVQVAEQAASETRAHLQRAVPAVELARLLIDEAGPAAGSETFARRFLALLRANPDFSWVSYSDESGSFCGAYHSTDGLFRVNRSSIHDGKTELDEHDVDGSGAWTLRRHVADTGYDPRTRPFYRLAAQAKRRVWTPPYVFFDQAVPGITCAAPRLDAAGKLVGVLTVDFDLNALSRFVAKVKPSAHGEVFLLTPDGVVLAHPTIKVVEQMGAGASGKLVQARDIDDPVVNRFIEALPSELGAGVRFRFEAHGEPWQASATPFAIDGDLRWLVGVAAPESDFMEAVDRQNRVALGISLAALVLALLIAVALSSRVARPLLRIAAEMERAGKLELDARAEPPSVFAEIQRMDASMRRMKSGLGAFAHYVPRDVVRAMLASGQEARLEGRVRPLTVLFSDVADFTTISETVSPDALVALLAGYFDLATRVIAEHGGTVDKFIGDGIMAFWGAPADDPAHALHACQAALAYQARLGELREEGVEWARRIHARIGLSTGDALVGNIGSTERWNYTAMGDTVNLAARLEGLNKLYGTRCLLAESTLLAAADQIVARPIDLVAVKGKTQPTRVYEPLALAASATSDVRRIAELFEQGLAAYLARDFLGAMRSFSKAHALRPDDRAAELLLARCKAYEAAPPDEQWTGVYVAKEK